MPSSQNYKRRYVACQHFPNDHTLRLQTGAGEDDIIHLPSGLDRVDCERQEEEEPVMTAKNFFCVRKKLNPHSIACIYFNL